MMSTAASCAAATEVEEVVRPAVSGASSSEAATRRQSVQAQGETPDVQGERALRNELFNHSDLTTLQAEELVARVISIRKEVQRVKVMFHGWSIESSVRAATKTVDLCLTDPRDGQKLHSMVALQRKLGLLRSAAEVETPHGSSEEASLTLTLPAIKC